MRVQRTLLILILLVTSKAALAAGGSNTQGTLFSGTGVDWQRTATAAQPVVSLWMWPFVVWPPSGTITVNTANLKIIYCWPDSIVHGWCVVQANAISSPPETQFCGHWLSESPILLLHAFNGEVGPDGSFEFIVPNPFGFVPPNRVTFACGVFDQWNPPEAEWDAMGALGKCIQWQLKTGGFGFPPTNSSAREFQTCVRMVRADYCGDGVSHTKDGTVIEPHRIAELPSRDLRPGFVFEANWDEKGAICIVHARYASLGPNCRDQFPVRIAVSPAPKEKKLPNRGQLGTEYHCRGRPFRDGCGEVKGKEGKTTECLANVDAWTRLNAGVLFDDSLIQP